nr:4Fe-4S binding protein [candidate division Zixibacteria bacterium]
MIEQKKHIEVNRLVNAKSDRWIPVIDLGRCKGCGKCVEACPRGVLEVRRINSADYEQLGWIARMRIRHHGMQVAYAVGTVDCQSCGRCLEVCRKQAIHLGPLISDATQAYRQNH